MSANYYQPPTALLPSVCRRCGIGGCDVIIKPCGCGLHSRCTPLTTSIPMKDCPGCGSAQKIMDLVPMSFTEMDEAKKAAAEAFSSGKRDKKRKSATIARLNPDVHVASSSTTADADGGEGGDLRTGRWTTEEIAYCDFLISSFSKGELPVSDGTKLNDFLSTMLKSKQSRLTKKMKNAKLSTQSFQRTTGYIANPQEARQFSEAEDSFLNSISCSMERAEIRFHLQKEWRELFSGNCVSLGHALNADEWLSSIEEVDRRLSIAKDAARMQRRKKMMGYAFSQDIKNPDKGVFIQRSAESDASDNEGSVDGDAMKRDMLKKLVRIQPPPFLGRVVSYLERHMMPFEHVDAWVPSFVSNQVDKKCRLCYAGAASASMQIGEEGRGSVPLSPEDQFDLYSFGEYSEKFSFDVGCGLPGRVYQTGIPSWEQNVQSAPHSHFERCGGASQWGIKTVLGLPIPSPNVGRIVVLMYSRHDRNRDQAMVAKLANEMTKLLPSPKWKLVVDLAPSLSPVNSKAGMPGNIQNVASMDSPNSKVDDMLRLMQDYMPKDSLSPNISYLPGFTSLRHLLLKGTAKTDRETQLVTTLTNQLVAYEGQNRARQDIALLLARDFMMMTQQHQQQQQQQQQQHQLQFQSHTQSLVQPQQQQLNQDQYHSHRQQVLSQQPQLQQQLQQPQHINISQALSHPGMQTTSVVHNTVQLTPAQMSLIGGGGSTPGLTMQQSSVHLDPLSQLQQPIGSQGTYHSIGAPQP